HRDAQLVSDARQSLDAGGLFLRVAGALPDRAEDDEIGAFTFRRERDLERVDGATYQTLAEQRPRVAGRDVALGEIHAGRLAREGDVAARADQDGDWRARDQEH